MRKKPEHSSRDCIICENPFMPSGPGGTVCFDLKCKKEAQDRRHKKWYLKNFKTKDYKEKSCLICDEFFKPKTKRSRFCSGICKRKHYWGIWAPENHAKRRRERMATDEIFKLSRILRGRFKNEITKVKLNKAPGDWLKLLGCTLKEFRDYIEEQFLEEMSWSNHGEWHLDHIKPVSSFELTNPTQIAECFHYTNFQPLWSVDNLKKGAKIDI